MIDSLLSNPLWLQILRFLLGSTFLLGGVWVLVRLGLVRNLRLEALLWKGALTVSVLLLLPAFNGSGPEFVVTGSAAPQAIIDTQPTLPGPGEPATLSTSRADAPQLAPATYQPSLSSILFIAWLSFTLVLLYRLVKGYHHGLQAMGKREVVPRDSLALAEMRTLSREIGLRWTPRLTTSQQITSPVTLPHNEICLPSWTLADACRSEMKSMLAHELGHIRQRDLPILLGIQLLICLLPFQPLLRTASSRLVDIAEYLADHTAVELSGDPELVASVLVQCADRLHAHPSPYSAIAMVGAPSRLKSRIQNLLGSSPGIVYEPGRLQRSYAVLALVGAAFLVPSFRSDTFIYAAQPHIEPQQITCNKASYDDLADQVHRSTLSPAEGLAVWEQNCGTESGIEIDTTWKTFGLDGHHLWYMAQEGNFDPSTAGLVSQNPGLISTMELLMRWLSGDNQETTDEVF